MHAVKAVCDTCVVATLIGALVHALPPLAAGVTFIWYGGHICAWLYKQFKRIKGAKLVRHL